jgi:hypothetical protein
MHGKNDDGHSPPVFHEKPTGWPMLQVKIRAIWLRLCRAALA